MWHSIGSLDSLLVISLYSVEPRRVSKDEISIIVEDCCFLFILYIAGALQLAVWLYCDVFWALSRRSYFRILFLKSFCLPCTLRIYKLIKQKINIIGHYELLSVLTYIRRSFSSLKKYLLSVRCNNLVFSWVSWFLTFFFFLTVRTYLFFD